MTSLPNRLVSSELVENKFEMINYKFPLRFINLFYRNFIFIADDCQRDNSLSIILGLNEIYVWFLLHTNKI